MASASLTLFSRDRHESPQIARAIIARLPQASCQPASKESNRRAPYPLAESGRLERRHRQRRRRRRRRIERSALAAKD